MEIPKAKTQKILKELGKRIAATMQQSTEPEKADVLADALFECISYLDYHESILFDEEEILSGRISYADHNIY